ncbi:hypothetical protein B0H67DRAFT_578689 [Lasiosphaeris hirsuta]|uniref:Uncharacterized protein n=1 Tax=Lasiosphaeris hirsuta TaxID=260670 RepID=A0AA40DSL1_9PEZI|nr:hypothetical protein B0H67DRAFT_578689 [Lasiosphaeris hirsuta]
MRNEKKRGSISQNRALTNHDPEELRLCYASSALRFEDAMRGTPEGPPFLNLYFGCPYGVIVLTCLAPAVLWPISKAAMSRLTANYSVQCVFSCQRQPESERLKVSHPHRRIDSCPSAVSSQPFSTPPFWAAAVGNSGLPCLLLVWLVPINALIDGQVDMRSSTTRMV